VVIADVTWTYLAPNNPGAAATALGAGVRATQQEQIVANHKDDQISYAEYLGVQEAGKGPRAPQKAVHQLQGRHHPLDD